MGLAKRTVKKLSILSEKVPKKKRFAGHKWEYSYVSREKYRNDYRHLAKWEKLWGNYERRHPTYNDGLPAFGRSVEAKCETDLGISIDVLRQIPAISVVAELEVWQIRISVASAKTLKTYFRNN